MGVVEETVPVLAPQDETELMAQRGPEVYRGPQEFEVKRERGDYKA